MAFGGVRAGGSCWQGQFGGVRRPRDSRFDTMASSVDLDEYIARLIKFKPDKRTACLTEEELQIVCEQSKELLLSQPSMLELAAPIQVLGDVHGQYNDLLRLFGTHDLS